MVCLVRMPIRMAVLPGSLAWPNRWLVLRMDVFSRMDSLARMDDSIKMAGWVRDGWVG